MPHGLPLRIIVLLATSLVVSVVGAGAATIEKIADTNTLLPGLPPASIGFSFPVICQGKIAFAAGFREPGPDSGYVGIYTWANGMIETIVHPSVSIPGGTGTFTYAENMAYDGESVAFVGYGAMGQQGIYSTSSGLHVVADRNTTAATSVGPAQFTSFGGVQLDGQRVIFSGHERFETGDAFVGIYAGNGQAVTPLVDWQTAAPGGQATFGATYELAVDDGRLAFHGTYNENNTGVRGIYLKTGDLTETVADTNTMIPGGTGHFAGFSRPAIDGDNVAFLAFGETSISDHGLYACRNGSLRAVATLRTPVPGGIGTFTGFHGTSGISIDGDNIAFAGLSQGATAPNSGLYVDFNGTLTRIIDHNDLLDGKSVRYFVLSPQSLGGDKLAFLAAFEDETLGLYVATIPEPASLALIVLGTLFLWKSRHPLAA